MRFHIGETGSGLYQLQRLARLDPRLHIEESASTAEFKQLGEFVIGGSNATWSRR
jgi:hypothetical protein